MEQEVIRYFISQGAFAVLFVCLFYYVLSNNKEREVKMQTVIDKNQEIIFKNQQVISDLAKKFDVLEDVKTSVDKIEQKLG